MTGPGGPAGDAASSRGWDAASGRGWDAAGPRDGADPVDAAVGSVAEEAAKLLRVLGGQSDGPEHEHAAPGSASAHRVPMGQGQSCTWCPLCRGVALVRSLSPETLERLADLAGLAAITLTDLAGRAAAHAHAASAAPGQTRPGAAGGHERTPTGRPGWSEPGHSGWDATRAPTQVVPVADDDRPDGTR